MRDKDFTILYVEDDEDTREELSIFFEQKCNTLHVCENGKDGLDTYKKVSPDLIISDIQMPILNGIDMAKEIRKLNQFVPIILLTAFNEVSYLKASIDINITSYITKPVNLEELNQKIDEIFYPEKTFILKFLTDGNMVIKSVEGNWTEIAKSEDELIGNTLDKFALSSHKDSFKTLLYRLRKDGFLLRERVHFNSFDNSVVEYLVDGKKIEDNLFKISLIKMQFFVHSYAKVYQLIRKEKDLRNILIYKKNIHLHTIESTSVDEFYYKICNTAVNVCGYDFGLIYQESKQNADEYILNSSVFQNKSHGKLFKKLFMLQKQNRDIYDKLISNTPLLVKHSQYKNLPLLAKPEDNQFIKNILIVPIFLLKHAHPMGFLIIGINELSTLIENEFSKADNIGLTIGIGKEMIENKITLNSIHQNQINHSKYDPLTGIYSLSAFNKILSQSIHEGSISKEPLSLLCIDLDDFKTINDKYGYKTGDNILIEFAKNTMNLKDKTDVFARVGGEKFSLLVNGDLKSAKEIATRLANHMRSNPTIPDNPVTLSIGIAQIDYENKEDKDTLIQKADRKMYEAKVNGKDQISF